MTESLGQRLREAREAKGYVLEDVERVTHIRVKHLAALEAGDFNALPSDAQVRGFLRNYAQFLSLDSEQILENYKAARERKAGLSSRLSPNAQWSSASAAPEPAPEAHGAPSPPKKISETGRSAAFQQRLLSSPPVSATPQNRLRRWRLLSPDVLVGGTVTLLIVVLLFWGAAQFITHLLQTPTPTVSATTTASGATSAATLPPLEATATIQLPTPLATYTGVNLSVRAEQRVWVRVTVDGAEAFAGLLPPGASKEFTGQNVIELVTGNGQGTRVIWNGRDQGTLGEMGEVVDRLWTVDGMIVPTPTAGAPVSTPTQTPTP